MKKINEIFYSLQGEGYHTGIPAIFVRFSGCNMKCSFCDTLHEDGIMMSDEEIISEVVKYPASMVVLTGGEPGLWIDESLVDALHNEGKYVCVETNGTCVLPDNVDWVTCSPKEGGEVRLNHIGEGCLCGTRCICLFGLACSVLFYTALFLFQYRGSNCLYSEVSQVAIEFANS